MIRNEGFRRPSGRLIRYGGRPVAVLGACLAVALVPAVGSASAAPGAATGCASATPAAGPTRIGTILGLVRPIRTATHCAGRSPIGEESAYAGDPPLINHGGPVMSTPATANQVVVTPIYWAPSGHTFSATYMNIINNYLADIAADSDHTTNVFASDFQYSGSNGAINYRVNRDTPITDTTDFPAAGCTTNTGAIYADSSAYFTCLDDAQLQAEIASVIAANSLTADLGHIFVLFLPKGVESCFSAGNPLDQACTINSTASTAYCAYHSSFASSAQSIYAAMPFPIYESSTGYSCTLQSLGTTSPQIQSPNGDPDADVEVSPLSHEMNEAITDPDGNAWYDISGNENGDDCAYIYGALSGSSGAYYNQTVNGAHYLTQEEFSNADFALLTSGCIQGILPVVPTITSLSSTTGTTVGGQTVTITGTGFPGATAVHFGGTASTAVTVIDATHVAATAPPAGANGTVDVTVTTGAGSSATSSADQYTYVGPPTVTGVSPNVGPLSGGRTVTITGTKFGAGATVRVGGTSATSVIVHSATKLSARVPAHAAGTVDVRVTTTHGTSAAATADHFTYLRRPTVGKVSPSSGKKAGGKVVTITGTSFGAGATVHFGKTAGKSVKLVSSKKITVRTPKHAKGVVDVIVTTPGGKSAAKKADHYTFT